MRAHKKSMQKAVYQQLNAKKLQTYFNIAQLLGQEHHCPPTPTQYTPTNTWLQAIWRGF